MRIHTVLALVAVSGLLLVACSGDGGGKTTPTAQPVVAHTIERRAHTGVPPLDQALDAALAPDRIEMAGLTGYQHVACAAQGDAAHPPCRDNEAAGLPVEIFPTEGCAGGWVRPEYLPDAYAAALEGKDPKLAAVYQPTAGIDPYGAQYIAVIATGEHENGATSAVALHVKNGRIIGLENDCGDAVRLFANARVAAWVLRPNASSPEGATPAADSSAPPGSTPAPIIRPSSVPAAARLVSGAFEVGDQSPGGKPPEAQHILYAVRCAGDVLVVSTTKETLYADLPCSKVLPDEVFRSYLAQPVLLRVDDGDPRQLHLVSGALGSLGFQVGNVWVLTR
jgi:hypothetical protein